MNREYHHWYSPSLQRDMELLVFGHGGVPVLVYPTSMGRFFEYEDRGMVGALREQIDGGNIQLYCVDSVDAESWYNGAAHPRWRVMRHVQYEQYIINEAIPFIKGRNFVHKLHVTGCSFGGYHAINFTLRHPELVDSCISLGGAFDIKPFLQGYYDDDVYFNNPPDYLPGMKNDWYLSRYRAEVGFILAAGEWDMCLDANLKLSAALNDKGVKHWLDVWGDHAKHDWPWWHMMIRKYLS